MRWSDIDLDVGWWTLPEQCPRNGLAHRIPLSTEASTEKNYAEKIIKAVGDVIEPVVKGLKR